MAEGEAWKKPCPAQSLTMLSISKRHQRYDNALFPLAVHSRTAMASITIITLSLLMLGILASSNLTDQYRLCKTEADIAHLIETEALIRIDAQSTDGAMHPSWPAMLSTVATSIYSLITMRAKHPRFPWVLLVLPVQGVV